MSALITTAQTYTKRALTGRALSWFCVLVMMSPITFAMSPYHESCIQQAAMKYYQPSDPVTYAGLIDLIHALMGVETGCGRTHRNDNGSIDYGCMQINTSTLHRLAQSGYYFDPTYVQYADCQNILLGTWVIESELKTGRDLWISIGNYNSHTPHYNREYQLKVWHQLQLIWANRLAQH
jgi:hypothetical protein